MGLQKAIIVLGLLSFSISGCDNVKNLFSGSRSQKAAVAPGQAESAPAPAAAPPAEVVQSCPNGAKIQIVSGDCGGEWAVVRSDKKMSCEYRIGPRLNCPEGMLRVPSVCYGTISKPPIENQTTLTPEKCASTYGKVPQPLKYSLNCCPG